MDRIPKLTALARLLDGASDIHGEFLQEAGSHVDFKDIIG